MAPRSKVGKTSRKLSTNMKKSTMVAKTYEEYKNTIRALYEFCGPGLKGHYQQVLEIIEQQEPKEAAEALWRLYDSQHELLLLYKARDVERFC